MYYTFDKSICKEQSFKTMKNYFGENLRYLRLSTNITQIDLSVKLHTRFDDNDGSRHHYRMSYFSKEH